MTRTILAALLLTLAPACGDGEPPATGCATPPGASEGYCTMWCRSDDCPPTEDGRPVACRPADGGGKICTL